MSLQTDDPVKSKLLRKADQQRDEIKGEVKELSARTEKVITNALLIGGALALGYFVVRGLSARKTKRKASKAKAKNPVTVEDDYETSPSLASTLLSDIGNTIATQATAILIELAKEKLVEYLENRSQKKEEDEHS